mgnify:CR=1 FL=1
MRPGNVHVISGHLGSLRAYPVVSAHRGCGLAWCPEMRPTERCDTPMRFDPFPDEARPLVLGFAKLWRIYSRAQA